MPDHRSLDLPYIIALLPSATGTFQKIHTDKQCGLFQNKSHFHFQQTGGSENEGLCLLLPLSLHRAPSFAGSTVATSETLRIYTRGTFLGPF